MSRTADRSARSHGDDVRRWHIPPPVLGLTGLTGPEGQVILEEIAGDAGALLWRTFRTAANWSAVPADRRADAFPPAVVAERRDWTETSDLSEELRRPLRTLADLLDADSGVGDAAAGEAAGEIGEWAISAGHRRTSAEFHQLACSIRPDDPALALAAAKVTRDLADYARAEVWLQRAVGLARREGDWHVYIRAHLAYGVLLRRRGNLPLARRWVERALRRANRQGLRLPQAKAFHDLFAIDLEMGRLDRAELFAERAFRAYPNGDPGLLRLVHDLAFLWMERGAFASAMRTFAVLKGPARPDQMPYILGNLARSAGALGDHATFEQSRAELADLPPIPAVAEAWLEVGRGALHLGRDDEARAAANEAGRLAGDRREHRIEFLVEDFLREIDETQRHGAPAAPPTRSPRNPSFPDEVVAAVGALALT